MHLKCQQIYSKILICHTLNFYFGLLLMEYLFQFTYIFSLAQPVYSNNEVCVTSHDAVNGDDDNAIDSYQRGH